MSRVFTDANLMTWEAYSSGGKFGLPDNPLLVFNCLSDPGSPPRFVVYEGADTADAEEAVHSMPEDRLRTMLAKSAELR